MGQVNPALPVAGSTLNSIADPELVTAFAQILSVINGGVDATNLAAALAQAAGVNQAAQTVKGVCVNAGPGTRTNTAYGALSDAPDQVPGIVLPTNGLIVAGFQATWQEQVSGAARAAIFIGSNQLKTSAAGSAAPVTQAAATNGGVAARPFSLATANIGLVSAGQASPAYTGDVTTGQVAGLGGLGSQEVCFELNGGVLANSNAGGFAGPCYIDNLPAGIYTISVQFKSSSGTVTASNRKLWVQALSFT